MIIFLKWPRNSPTEGDDEPSERGGEMIDAFTNPAWLVTYGMRTGLIGLRSGR